ncbi:MAG: zinc ribbon domain-containing protein [Candidatus Eremiobacteraeota bacterium]|nr:zinc ribbon domain-containing protein [Candidatus Eremiobacteraeota bacterium]MCL5054834.1 zinc ribbon domain-containing protein [Bacillota bacterium]
MDNFLDRVKGVVDKGVTAASVRSKEFMETSRLRTKLETLSAEKDTAIVELGSIVFTLYKQEKLEKQSERVLDKCKNILEIEKKIHETEQEIERVRKEAEEILGRSREGSSSGQTCECGSPIKTGVKFCGSCGKNLLEVLEKIEKEANLFPTCSHCGTKGSKPNAKFCPGCGAPFPSAPMEQSNGQPQK